MEEKDLLPKHSPSRYIAIVLYFIALGVDIFRFVLETSAESFSTFSFVVLAFDVVFGVFFLLGVIKRNFKLLNLMLIIFKVFDGTYYIFFSAMRIDEGSLNTLDRVMTDFCTVAGFLSLATLLLFCLHYYLEEKKYWIGVKISIILTGIILAVACILAIINVVNEDSLGLEYMGEVLFMCMQTFAIYAVCEYVDNKE